MPRRSSAAVSSCADRPVPPTAGVLPSRNHVVVYGEGVPGCKPVHDCERGGMHNVQGPGRVTRIQRIIAEREWLTRFSAGRLRALLVAGPLVRPAHLDSEPEVEGHARERGIPGRWLSYFPGSAGGGGSFVKGVTARPRLACAPAEGQCSSSRRRRSSRCRISGASLSSTSGASCART